MGAPVPSPRGLRLELGGQAPVAELSRSLVDSCLGTPGGFILRQRSPALGLRRVSVPCADVTQKEGLRVCRKPRSGSPASSSRGEVVWLHSRGSHPRRLLLLLRLCLCVKAEGPPPRRPVGLCVQPLPTFLLCRPGGERSTGLGPRRHAPGGLLCVCCWVSGLGRAQRWLGRAADLRDWSAEARPDPRAQFWSQTRAPGSGLRLGLLPWGQLRRPAWGLGGRQALRRWGVGSVDAGRT